MTLVNTPVIWTPGNPNDHKGGDGTYNGEPNWPARSGSSDALPEKTLDSCGNFANAGKGKG